MRILISADMEGISGVIHWDDVTPGTPGWERTRTLMADDVNAAIQGCLEAGAERVFVTDGHWHSRNLRREDLDQRAWLNSGSPLPFSMMQGIDSGVDGVCLVGYHARAGTTNAVLCHTWSDSTVRDVWLNDDPVGEIGLNASLAGHFGASVIMLSGDQMAAKEVQEFINHDVEVAVVKKGRGYYAADLTPLPVAHEMICEAAARGVARLMSKTAPPPYRLSGPITLAVDFHRAEMAEVAALMPGTARLSGTKLAWSGPDMPQVQSAFRALVMLAKQAG